MHGEKKCNRTAFSKAQPFYVLRNNRYMVQWGVLCIKIKINQNKWIKLGIYAPEAVSKHGMQINTKQISRCPTGNCAVIGKGKSPDWDVFRSREELRCSQSMSVYIQTTSCSSCQHLRGLQVFPLPCLVCMVLSSEASEGFAPQLYPSAG